MNCLGALLVFGLTRMGIKFSSKTYFTAFDHIYFCQAGLRCLALFPWKKLVELWREEGKEGDKR